MIETHIPVSRRAPTFCHVEYRVISGYSQVGKSCKNTVLAEGSWESRSASWVTGRSIVDPQSRIEIMNWRFQPGEAAGRRHHKSAHGRGIDRCRAGATERYATASSHTTSVACPHIAHNCQ